MNWQEEYKKKIISAEDAASLVKSEDIVVIPIGKEPAGICHALAARKQELKSVTICPGLPGRDFAWYKPGWEDSFAIEASLPLPVVAQGVAERRFDYLVPDMLVNAYYDREKHIDILLLTLSPPDRHGYCSFGAAVWFKKQQIKYSRLVIAELDPSHIRTYGDNFVHVSEIDYFVEHVSTGQTSTSRKRDMIGRVVTKGPGEVERRLAENLSSLIKDGDTIEIGGGSAPEYMPQLGAFDNKHDLGIHTEIISAPLIHLVDEGVFTGARKTVHPGKVVGTAIGGGREEYDIVDGNPRFELYGADYSNDPRTIAANDNMVAINSGFAVDILGQIATDSIGYRVLAGTGGQLAFAIGALMSKGGRYIVVLPSTASDGSSRIVASFPPGTVVSVPRTLADYVVSEYGIASLRGKTQRRRAEELIVIGHPDFRAELRKQVKKIFWP